MLSNVQEFVVLLERYEDDPGLCSKMLRNHSLSDPDIFLKYVQQAIVDRPVNRATKFIAGLAISAGIIPFLVENYPRDKKTTIALAKKIMQCEPRFDTGLADYILRPVGAAPEEGAFYTVLDLLEAVSEGDKLVPQVLKLMRSANPKIRSKAALFVGSRTQNLTWTNNHNQEFDGRVRANMLESLFGLNSEVVHNLYRAHVNDEHNRCRGNAILGLYQLGDTAAIPLIYELAKHPEPLFRNTCAWVIGQTGDPRYVPVLLEMMKDEDELVRSQAFKSLSELKRNMRAACTKPQLQVELLRFGVDGEKGSVLATVSQNDAPLKGLSGVHFVARSGTPAKVVREFQFEEYDTRIPLNVAFMVCLPEQDSGALEQQYLAAVESCVPVRRSKDRWGLMKLHSKLRPARRKTDGKTSELGFTRSRYSVLNVADLPPSAASEPLEDFDARFEYTGHQHRFRGMASDPVVGIAVGSEVEEARAISEQLLRVDVASSRPQLIFLGVPPVELVTAIAAKKVHAAIMNLVCCETDWLDPQVRATVEASGGACWIGTAESAGEYCRSLCSSFLHHYRIKSAELADAPVELEVNVPDSRGVGSWTRSRIETLADVRAEHEAIVA